MLCRRYFALFAAIIADIIAAVSRYAPLLFAYIIQCFLRLYLPLCAAYRFAICRIFAAACNELPLFAANVVYGHVYFVSASGF